MVPVPSQCFVGGKPLTEVLGADEIEELVERTRKGGAEIVGLLKTGSAYYAPSAAAAKMVRAVTNVNVPRYTVIIGGSFGAGNYGMCGRGYHPRFLWMWPAGRISVMGGEQAANVLFMVKQAQLKKKGAELMGAKQEKAFKQPILDKYEEEGSPYYSTARIWDDGILDPVKTRDALALAMASGSHAPPLWEGGYVVYRM